MDQQKMKGTSNNIAYHEGAAIRGERVAAQFRKMHKVSVVHGTSTHNIQQTKLEGTVLCIVERPLAPLKNLPTKD
jgi:hypothetical protein